MTTIAIIGAGHNGLVCAYYLARAGHAVTVLEKRDVVGGAAVTEEFHPGFRNSVAAYTVSLLNPKIIRDLELQRHGLKIVEREISNFLPTEDGRYLKTGGGKTISEVAKFSNRDASQLDAYDEKLGIVADLLRDLVLETPPNVTTGRGLLASLPQLAKAGTLARRIGKLSTAMQQDVLNLFTQSAGDYLDQWFESAPIKAAYGFDGIVGNFASPYDAGSAYVLLHHVFGEVNGKKGAWGHAIGGMGAITQAMAKACLEAGVTIRVSSGVKRVTQDKFGVTGVELDNGEHIKAKAIASNLNPKLLFTRMIEDSALPEEFSRRMQNWKCGSGTFRMNVALSELPSFTALPGKTRAEHHTAGIIIAPTLKYMELAYFDAKTNGWSKNPIVELNISSTLDDTLAPQGAHVASMFCQHVSPELPDGSSWDDHRETVADLMIKTLDNHAPGFKASVIARQIHSPLDLERKFGLLGGDIFHGALSLDQIYSARPMLGYADHRTPIKGLYQCGSGTHPGGGVTGAPGHNAAREMLKDLH
jgi:phytoene dehydrogenase-like protein